MNNYYMMPLEICEVDGFICDMGTYDLDMSKDVKEQCYNLAKELVTGYVDVITVVNGEFVTVAEYEFDEFKCHCAD